MLTHPPLAIGLLLLGLAMPTIRPPIAAAVPLRHDLETIATRSTRYLDTQWDGHGWRYAVPAPPYRETERSTAGNFRLQLTFATFYRFRRDPAAREKVATALQDALEQLTPSRNTTVVNGRRISTRSFHDAIGLYLALRIIEREPTLLPDAQRRAALQNIRTALPWALRGNDTENRAALGAAYGLAVLNHPWLTFNQQERQEYLALIRRKAEGVLPSIGEDNLYREGVDRQFSVHYHLVTAAMLYYIGEALPEPAYRATADRMMAALRAHYPLGKLDWRPSHRPRGTGLQTVLLRAVAERSAGSADWERYWRMERQHRGFTDPTAPNRLVWRDEVDGTYNDDYSFASMVELFWDTLIE